MIYQCAVHAHPQTDVQQYHVEGVRMESDPSAFKPKNFGQIIGDSFGAYLIDIAEYIATASIVIIPVALCSGGLWALGDFARTAADGWSNLNRDLVAVLPYAVGTFLLSMLAYPLMQGALIHATEQKRLGQSISIRQAYHFALGHAGRLIGAWLLTGLLVAAMMGSLICFPFALFTGDTWLFILTAALAIGLPFGFFFTVKWLLVLQTVMLEESRAIQSLARSSVLVTGNWWRSLGIWVLLSVVPAFVAGVLVSVLLALWEDPNGFAIIVLRGVFPALLVVPLSTIAQTLLYFDLRARRQRYISQIMGEGMEVPPAPKLDLSPQMPGVQARQPGRTKLRPALIVIAVAVMLVGVITPTVVFLLSRADAGDTQVFVKSNSTGKQVRLGHSKLKTFDYTDFAFIVEFNGSVEVGEQENTVQIVKSGNAWSDGLARVQVFAQEETMAEFYQDVSLPEYDSSNELAVTVEVVDKHRILVSSTTGTFPAASHIALCLDYGAGSVPGCVNRLFTI
jgi:hypothetical protein